MIFMNNTQDNIQKRREEILDYINYRKQTNINEIAEVLKLSAITVRRDIEALSSENKVMRFFGGVKAVTISTPKASPISESGSLAYHTLIAKPPLEKQPAIFEIARTAAGLIDDGDVVLMNNSLTASYVLEYLGDKSVMVVTNSLFTLARSIGPNVKLCFLGGQTQRDRAGLVGGMAVDTLSRISATKCIMGIDGIDVLSGLTCKILEESYINQRIIQQTHGKRIVVAEGCRIAEKSAFYSGALNDISFLVPDNSADTTELSSFINCGITVQVVHPRL